MTGAVDEAAKIAEDALASTRERREAGLEAWALRLAAEVATERDPPDIARAEDLYREAMQRAECLGARPLVARCQLGIGSLYRRVGNHHDARKHLTAAAALFREMQMRFWSERVDAELRMLGG